MHRFSHGGMDGDSGTWNGHDSHDEDVDWDDLDDEELLAVDVDGVASAGTVTDAECIAPKCTEEQEDSLKARLVINPNKAGTQYVDKDRVAEIVYEASKVSPFFEFPGNDDVDFFLFGIS